MALCIGTIVWLKVERSKLLLTIGIRQHTRGDHHLFQSEDAEAADVVSFDHATREIEERFDSEAALLRRYDELVRIDEGSK